MLGTPFSRCGGVPRLRASRSRAGAGAVARVQRSRASPFSTASRPPRPSPTSGRTITLGPSRRRGSVGTCSVSREHTSRRARPFGTPPRPRTGHRLRDRPDRCSACAVGTVCRRAYASAERDQTGGMSVRELHAVLDALTAVRVTPGSPEAWGRFARRTQDANAPRPRPPHEGDREAAALRALGYMETDWRPVRVELAAPGEQSVDVHSLTFDAGGNAVRAGPDGATFYCALLRRRNHRRAHGPVLSVEQQIAFHGDYEPRNVDRADLVVLAEPISGKPSS